MVVVVEVMGDGPDVVVRLVVMVAVKNSHGYSTNWVKDCGW